MRTFRDESTDFVELFSGAYHFFGGVRFFGSVLSGYLVRVEPIMRSKSSKVKTCLLEYFVLELGNHYYSNLWSTVASSLDYRVPVVYFCC